MQQLKLHSINDNKASVLKPLIGRLYQQLNLVADGKPKLITFSKTMHFFVPDLLMPIDRTNTLKFFSSYAPTGEGRQADLYMEIFDAFRALAQQRDLSPYRDVHWNRHIPKIIDNHIIQQMRTRA